MRQAIVYMLLFVAAFAWCDYKENYDFGVRMYGDKLYDEAIGIFEDVIDEAPMSEEAEESLFMIGDCYEKQDKYQEAEIKFKQLYDRYPQSGKRDRALFHYARAQHLQKRYAEAAKSFDQLIAQYPVSGYTMQSLVIYIQGLYESGEYNRAITLADDSNDWFPENADRPQILLLAAKSLLKLQAPQEAKSRLNQIVSQFPAHDARWTAYGMELDLIAKEEGIQSAIRSLDSTLQGEVPRLHEEMLRFRLVKYYFELGMYREAYRQLDTLVSRFDQSENLDRYISWLTRARLALGKYSEIIESAERNAKVFKNSSLDQLQEYYSIRAKYLDGSYDQAQQEALGLLDTVREDSLRYETNYLIADIHRDMGRYKDAIKDYLVIINKYAQYGSNAEIYMQIGDIYHARFQEYGTAIRYYQLVASMSDDVGLQNRSLRQMAECYEQLGRYRDAVDALMQINAQALEAKERVEVEDRIDYLKKYRIADYEKAFIDLTKALNEYVEDGNKDDLRNNFMEIMAGDVKQIDVALDMKKDPRTVTDAFLRSKLLLRLLDRKMREGDQEGIAKARQELQSAKMLLMASSQLYILKSIELEEAYLGADRNPGAELIEEMGTLTQEAEEDFVPQWMRLVVGRYYIGQGDTLKAAGYLESLRMDSSISDMQYRDAKLSLGDFYYHKQEFQKAIDNYELAGERINLNVPETLYRYAKALGKVGKTGQALEKMAFLVNNNSNFTQYDEAIEYVAQSWRAQGDQQTALKYLLMTPEIKRNDEFYGKLGDIYVSLGDKVRAKEALMHIKEKDVETLRELASLQYETDDFSIAAYTLQQLVEKDKPNAWKYFSRLGDIAYRSGDYREASGAFDKLFAKSDDEVLNLANIDESDYVLEAIVSAYRIENRPKAEKLYDRFEKSIEVDNRREAEVKLNEGIYYVKMDAGKAESIFGKLIKRDETPADIKAEAYLWRGTVYIMRKKNEEAAADLNMAISSGSREVRKQAHFKMGTLLFTTEDYDNALTHYYYVIENDSTGTLAKDAARNFALVCKTIGEWNKAVSAYEIILDRWGDQDMHAETLFDIGYCYYRDRKYRQAVETFQKSIPLLENPEMKAEAQYWIGQAHFDDEAYDSAITAWLRVSYNYPDITRWAAVAELKSGEAYLMMNRNDKARIIFEKVVQKYGKGSDWGKEAFQKLKEL